MTDPRDGTVYKTVKIGNQVWMAENLDYAGNGGVYYENAVDPPFEKAGRLYTWQQAMEAVEPLKSLGWHLPSREEWQKLIDFANKGYMAGKRLKSNVRADWKVKGVGHIGTDDFRFKALPGGYHDSKDFCEVGNHGCWWSSTETATGDCGWWMCNKTNTDTRYCCEKNSTKEVFCAYYCYMVSNSDAFNWHPEYKRFLFSVRCVKD